MDTEMELKQEEVPLVATQVNTSPNSRTKEEPTSDDAVLDQTMMDIEEGRRRRPEPLDVVNDPKPKDSRKLKLKRKSLFLVLLTLALAAATAAVLWRCRGSPLLVAWRLSLSLCLVSFLWSTFLLGETTTTRAVFVRVSSCVLMACAADSSVGPNIGVIVVHLATHFAAGLVGYALAERRQGEGTERSAAATAAVVKTGVKRSCFLMFIAALYLAAAVLGNSWYAARVFWRAAAGEYAGVAELVLDLLVPLKAASLVAVIAALVQLRGMLFGDGAVVFGLWYYMFLMVLRLLCSINLGDVAAMVVTLVAALPFTGLLGYCLCVHDTFKQIVSENKGEASLKPEGVKSDDQESSELMG